MNRLHIFLENNYPFSILTRYHTEWRLKRKYKNWIKESSTLPMPEYGKQQVVIEYITHFRPEVFIETGTYKGKMVYAVMPYINEIYSIELDEKHAINAKRRFAGHPNIHLIQGQSGEILPELLKSIDRKILFWLDAHYSGGSTAKGPLETPIMQELDCILRHPKANDHIILIDDARFFTGQNHYPTLVSLKKVLLTEFPEPIIEIKNDIIRVRCLKPTRKETN